MLGVQKSQEYAGVIALSASLSRYMYVCIPRTDESLRRNADNILAGWEWPILPGKNLYLGEMEIGDF